MFAIGFMISILVLLVSIPLSFLWRAIKASQGRDELVGRMAARLREKFSEIVPRRPFFGPPRISFKADGLKVHLLIADKKRLGLHIEESPGVPLPVLIRSRRWSIWPAGGLLQRISAHDPLVDDSMEIYASTIFAGFLADRFLDGNAGETSRSELSDSLLVLGNLSGVKAFEFRFVPDHGTMADLKLKTEDLYYRVDELESLIHHLHKLHTRFATYDRWDPGEAKASEPEDKPASRRSSDP
jgi:hypothetical protein